MIQKAAPKISGLDFSVSPNTLANSSVRACNFAKKPGPLALRTVSSPEFFFLSSKPMQLLPD